MWLRVCLLHLVDLCETSMCVHSNITDISLHGWQLEDHGGGLGEVVAAVDAVEQLKLPKIPGSCHSVSRQPC